MEKNVSLTTAIFNEQPRDEAYTVDSREGPAWVLGNQ